MLRSLINDITHMFEIIDRDHIFMVTDQHLNRNYTHKKCRYNGSLVNLK